MIAAKLGADPAKWAQEAQAIVADVQASGIKLPDVGGANREGGTTPAQQGGGASPTSGSNLSPGVAAFDYVVPDLPWILLPDLAVTAVVPVARPGDEQPSSLLSLVSSRAPPRSALA